MGLRCHPYNYVTIYLIIMTTERYKHIPLMELIKLFYYDNVLYYIYEKQVCLVDT